MEQAVDGYRDYRCGECGKTFMVADCTVYAYKRMKGSSPRYFCSWACLRAHDMRQEAGRKRAARHA